MKVLKDPDCLPELYKMLRSLDLRDFNSTYSSLAARLRHSATRTRTQIKFETPPGQTTVPSDSNHSANSASSSSSAESKPEPYAQNLATHFINDTFSTIPNKA